MPEAISIQVDERFAGEVDAGDLAQAILAALVAEGRPEAEVTLVVGDDEEVRALNAQFLGEDRPTDVLSFPAGAEPAQDEGRGAHFVTAPEALSYLGDIIIAFPYARRQASELGRNVKAELRLLAVHGTLHLLGYDHAEPAEQAVMWARQEEILARLNP